MHSGPSSIPCGTWTMVYSQVSPFPDPWRISSSTHSLLSQLPTAHATQTQCSQNHSGWKQPLKSSSPTAPPALPSSPLSHVPKCHIHAALKSLQGWWLHHCPGSLCQCWTTCSMKEFFQPKPPQYILQLFPLFLSLITWEKWPTPTWLNSSFREF